jgi:acetyl esterase/lipase
MNILSCPATRGRIASLFVVTVALLVTSTCAYGQLTATSRWEKEFSAKYTVTKDIVYETVDTVRNRLDLYVPIDTSSAVPVLIWIHGGGWGRLSKDSVSGQLVHYLEMGWAVVNVEYRLTGVAPAPAAVRDCRCALHWVVRNAERLRIDPQRIVVSGTSAGGHLALMTGMLPLGNPLDTCSTGIPFTVAAIINWYGITDVADLLGGQNRKGYAVRWVGPRPDAREIAGDVSPLTYVRSNLPPVFTVHGDADTTVPYQHAVRLKEALDEAGVVNRLHTVHGGYHGKWGKEVDAGVYSAIDEFLSIIGLRARE